MSLFRVNKIQPKSTTYVELEDANLKSGVIDTNGNTNLGTAAEKPADYYFKKVTGTPNKHAMFGADGELEESGFGPGDISSLNSRMDTAEGQIAGLADGGPKGVFADLAALNSANPSHDYIYLLSGNGHWAYYDLGTTAFVDSGQVYSDSAALAELAGAGRSTETVKGNADALVAHKAAASPHIMTDGVTNYSYGLSISTLRGFRHLQLNIEEEV